MDDDETYVLSSDCVSLESSLDEISVTSDIPSINEISEDDITECTIAIYEYIERYIDENMLNLYTNNFKEDLLKQTTEDIFITFLSIGLCEDDEEDFEEVSEFIEQVVEVYMELSLFPERSRRSSIVERKENINIKEIEKKLDTLKLIPQPKQKSKEWYEIRYNMLTASNVYKVFGSESQMNSLIYEKCKPLNSDNEFMFNNVESAMHWGNKYEPVTIMVYENMFGTTVGEYGCIPHRNYPYVGASPDGINVDPSNERFGRLIEIKNIKNREITGIPKPEYWVQTQMQMEICELDECDFVETRFLEYASPELFFEDSTREYRGVILYFIERANVFKSETVTSNMPTYKYMPLDVSLDKEVIGSWILNKKEEEKQNGLVLFSTIYWYLDEISVVFIPRNKFWFSKAIPKIQSIWETILKERVEGYEHRARNKRPAKTQVTSNDASNSYSIQNLILKNSICLVKLD
jgi:putative phage-type endonuclease